MTGDTRKIPAYASLLVMNFPNLTRFFIVRRAGPSTTERDCNDSLNLLHAGRGDTWVDNFIRALDVATALGAVFPPLKATTQTLNVILKDYQVYNPFVCVECHVHRVSYYRMFVTIWPTFKA